MLVYFIPRPTGSSFPALVLANLGIGIAFFHTRFFCYYSIACNSRVYMTFVWFFLISSVTNLSTLTCIWDRYIAFVHPFKHNYYTSMTERRPKMVILVAWLILLAIATSLFMVMYITTFETARNVLQAVNYLTFYFIFCWWDLRKLVRSSFFFFTSLLAGKTGETVRKIILRSPY